MERQQPPAFAAIWQRRKRHREKPMDLPRNKFKAALVARRQQLGLWCTSGDPFSAEVVAGSGFDWLLLDTEHSPTDVLTVLPVLQAVASYDVAAVVRPATNDTVLIKRYLDIGAQTLLIPYVQSAAEAQHAVAAMRYPRRAACGVLPASREPPALAAWIIMPGTPPTSCACWYRSRAKQD